MDAGGTHEPQRDGVEGLGALTGLVGDVEVDGVHRPPTERGRGERDPRAGVTRHVAVLARHAGAARLGGREAAGRAAHRGEQILGAPHHPGAPGRGGDLLGADHAERRLHEREDRRPGRGVNVGHLRGRLALGEHDAAVRGPGDGLEVGRVVLGAHRVDAHDRALGIQRRGPQRVPGRRAVGRRDGVLEVEDHHIRPVGGLAVALRPIGRAEQQRRPGRDPGRGGGHAVSSPAGRLRTRVLRTARATMSPCWLRPMCSSVTMPSPGRDFDSRLSVQTVSA